MRDLDPSEAAAPQHIPAALNAHFEIVRSWPRGGTLLAPIFGSGCLDSAMATTEEGANVLSAMFKAEHDLIKAAALPSDSYCYVAKGRPAADVLVRTAFEQHASPLFRAGRPGSTATSRSGSISTKSTPPIPSSRANAWPRSCTDAGHSSQDCAQGVRKSLVVPKAFRACRRRQRAS
jgi:hypothetical protein